MGKRTKVLRTIADKLQAEELTEKIAKGDIVDNSGFFAGKIVPIIEQLVALSATDDDEAFAEPFRRSLQIEYYNGKKTAVYRALHILKGLAAHGTVKPSPFWEFTMENSMIARKEDLAQLIVDGGDKWHQFNGFVSLHKEARTRIANPGIEFKFAIQEGKLFVCDVSAWNAKDETGFDLDSLT